MTSPTNHEGGAELGRRVSDEMLAINTDCHRRNEVFANENESPLFIEARLHLDLVDARAAITAERERAETAERERDEARAEVQRLRGVAVEAWDTAHNNKADLDALRDREQRGGQVTDNWSELQVARALCGSRSDPNEYGGVDEHGICNQCPREDQVCAGERLQVRAILAALAACPTGQPSDPAEARIAEAVEAERERCARIAQDDDGHLTVCGEDRNTAMCQRVAREIAAAIRAPRDEESGRP